MAEVEKRKELLENILNVYSKQSFQISPNYFLGEFPSRDEEANFGIELIEGKSSFCFHGSWFSNNLYLKRLDRPITNADIMINELDNLGRYMFNNYPAKNGFLENIEFFYDNLIRINSS